VHNGAVIEAVHPVYGRYRRVRSPARFSASVADPIRPAPLYGEDTDAILEDLGHDAAERERLRALGVVR